MRSLTELAAAAALVMSSSGVAAAYRGETFVCHFPVAGKVVLDTREPGASITYRGKRYPATSGSYFYQTESTTITMAFNPPMTKWTLTLWDRQDPKPEKAKSCTRKKNTR